jgi:hypothetical protein
MRRPPTPDEPKPGSYSDDEVDYLLAGGRLGQAQKDRVSRNLARSVAGDDGSRARARPPMRRRIIATLASAAAAAACLALAIHLSHDGDGFRSRGGNIAPALSFDIECLGGQVHACPRGSTLAFSSSYAAAGLFLTAYLEPQQDPTNEARSRVWLLSNETIPAPSPQNHGFLLHGARLSEQQAPGGYLVRILLTRRPLSHEQAVVAAGTDVAAQAQIELTVSP